MKKSYNYRFAVRILLRKLNKLTVAEVQWLFRLYRSEHVKFNVRGQTGMLYAASMALIYNWTWIKPQDFASNLLTRFEGGPVSVNHRQAYYNGTLVTFLVDRIMLHHQRYGTSLIWLLRFSAEDARVIWHQLKDSTPGTLKKYSVHPKRAEAPTQKTLFDLDNPVVEMVNVGDCQIPIHENGVQGCVPPQGLRVDGLYLWSDYDQTGVYM